VRATRLLLFKNTHSGFIANICPSCRGISIIASERENSVVLEISDNKKLSILDYTCRVQAEQTSRCAASDSPETEKKKKLY